MRGIGLIRRATDINERKGRRRPRGRAAPQAAEGSSTLGVSSTPGSGLRRALRIREREAAAESGEGINENDRRDILAELDSVAKRNRISVGPDSFVIESRRNGLLFPLAVNLIAVAATVAIVLSLSMLFRQREVAIAGSSAALDTAEGKLLEEFRRDSDSKLREKDKAIGEIRNKLSSIDKERLELASSIDERVKAKEEELREGMRRELEAEKSRLSDQGLGAAALQAKMKAFEAERASALDKAIAEARAQAAAERAAAASRYEQLRAEYQRSMAQLGDERRRLQEETRSREAALSAAMEAKAKELESQTAAARAGLEQAKSSLARMEEQRYAASLEEDRILGLYGSIRAALRDLRYADAISSANALAAYLKDPAAAPASQPRRDADLFVAQTIAAYAKIELDRSSADAGRLLAQAELLASARSSVAAAQAALRAGDRSLAAAKYREALGVVPGILEAHAYFADQQQAAEAAARARLQAALAAAERSFRSGDFGAASASYAEALGYLPLDPAEREGIAARLAQIGASDAERARRASDTMAARRQAELAAAALAAKDWPGAISGYIALLSAYPRADQAGAALEGIERARSAMAASAEESAASQASGKSGEAELRAELEAATKSLADAEEQASRSREAAKAELDALKRQLAEAQARTASSAAAANPAIDEAAKAAQAGELERLRAEAKRLAEESAKSAEAAAAYKVPADKYAALEAKYRTFLKSEASSGGKDGLGSALSSQSGLYAFLGEAELAEALPGLKEKVASYQAAVQSEALDAFPSDASEIVRQALAYKDKAALRAYYAAQRSAYQQSGNRIMVNFLDGVSKVID